MILALPTVQNDAAAQIYQIQYSTAQICGGEMANQVTDVALGIARKVGEFCEEQNVLAAKNGNARCPPLTCMSESKPGGTAPGSLKVIISYGTEFQYEAASQERFLSPSFPGSGSGSGSSSGSSSGGVISIPGGSIGSGNRSGSGGTQSLNISVELTIPLGRTPDQLTCYNPVSSAFPSTLTTELLQKMISNPEGCSK